MILCSTLRKLAAKRASIYRVDIPARTVRIGAESHAIPAGTEWFATRAQADRSLEQWRAMGATDARVIVETADMSTHYMRT